MIGQDLTLFTYDVYLWKDFKWQAQVFHFSKLWLTFTLCAEERTSQRSCWWERKSLRFHR